VILQRVLSVLAAICLVGAFSLALIVSPTEPLTLWLGTNDHELLLSLYNWTTVHAPPLVHYVLVPILGRPVWLVPGCLGLVFLGLVVTLGSRKAVTEQRRRRS